MVRAIRERYRDVVIVLCEVNPSASCDETEREKAEACNRFINIHYKDMKNVFVRKPGASSI